VAAYDVQYRTLEGPAWMDWLNGYSETSAIFHGEEGVTYLFRMRACDVVMNKGPYSEDGDTITTVDTIAPSVRVIRPRPGEAATEGIQELRVDACDDTCRLEHGDVLYSLDEGPWIEMTRVLISVSEWRAIVDTSSLTEGDHSLIFQAMDKGGSITAVMVTMVVDNNDPSCEVVSPRSGELVTGIHLFRIIAQDSLAVANVDLHLTGIPGSSHGKAVYNTSSMTWELAVDTVFLPEGEASYTAQAVDTSGRRSPLVGPIHFIVDNQGPIVEFISPSPDEFIVSSAVSVTITVTDLNFDPVEDEVFLKIDQGGWTPMTPAGIWYVLDWDLTDVPDGEHILQARATDKAGHLTIAETIAMVDKHPPEVNVVEPETGAAVMGDVTLVLDVVVPFLDEVQFTLDGKEWTVVEDGTATFDSTMYPDGLAIIEIMAMDLNGAESTTMLSILVDNTPPEIVPVEFPTMGQHVGGEVPFEMFVDDEGGMGTVHADLSGDIATLTVKPSTGVYLFTLDSIGVPDGPVDVVFLAIDRAGNEASLTWTVHVDNTPPEIEVLAPGRDADGTIEFTVDITDDSTISEVQLKIGDRPWVFMFRAVDGTFRHQWDTGTRDNEKDINFKVRATDEVGNTAEQVQRLDVTNPPYAYVGLAILMALVLLGIYILYQRRGKDEVEELVTSEEEEEVVPSEEGEEASEDEKSEGPDKALVDAPDEAPSEVPDAVPTDGEPVEPTPESTGRPKTGTAGTRPPAAQEGWVESADD
jgi:hypothetical protein